MHDKGYKHKHGEWNHSSAVINILDNPLYIGKINFKGLICDGLHEPILSPETFEKVQLLRDKKRKKYRKRVYKSTSLLTGLIFCGNCGGRYFVRSVSGQYKYYACYSRSKNHRHMIKDPTCKNKSWQIPLLDKMVEEEILKLAFDKKELKKVVSWKSKEQTQANTDHKIIKKKIETIDKQIKKLMDLYQLDTMPMEEVGKRIEALYNDKKALQSQLPEVTKETPDTFNLDWVHSVLDNTKLIWEHAELDEKRNILRSLINRILVYDDKIKIEWSFV